MFFSVSINILHTFGGFRYVLLFAACFAAVTFLLANNRAHAHKRMCRRTVPSRDRGQKRNDKAGGDGGEWNTAKLSLSKSTRTNCYRYYVVVVVLFCIKDLGRVVMSNACGIQSICRKVKLTRVWFALCFSVS